MNKDRYTLAIEDIFSELEPVHFIVNYNPRIVFICGGPIESNNVTPASLRERILNELSNNHDEIEKNTVVAEKFSDYFQAGQYKNLMQFEEDIANLASLIVICLESEGSLVEFGLFCNHHLTSEKLLVYVPEEHYIGNDSFITLGPLAQLQASSENSVLTYPFPDKTIFDYDHIEAVVGDLIERLEECNKTDKFDPSNSGHLAFLIRDIVSICYPIKKQEISNALTTLDIKINDDRLVSLLYSLGKVGLIQHHTYSSVDYYYTLPDTSDRIKFGKHKDGTQFDRGAKFVQIRQEIMLDESRNQVVKKRRLALKRITQLFGGQD